MLVAGAVSRGGTALPGFTVKQYWHVRYHHDADNRWLRRTAHGVRAEGKGYGM